MLSIRQDQNSITIRRYHMTNSEWKTRSYTRTPEHDSWLERQIGIARVDHRVDTYESDGVITYVVRNKRHYRIINGTSYDERTPLVLCQLLDGLRRGWRSERIRVKITYGMNGAAYDDDPEVGYISRSTGTRKIPILVHNQRSTGGGAILTHCIVKVECANKKHGEVLYSTLKDEDSN